MKITSVFHGIAFLKFVASGLASTEVKYEEYAAATSTTITNSGTRSKVADSLVECAIICTNDNDCCTASYNKSAHTCRMNSKCCPEIELDGTDVVLQKLPTEDNPRSPSDKPKDCSYLPVDSPAGVYTIYPDSSNGFHVYCEDGWTIFQRHTDGGRMDFGQNWESYKTGFGDLRFDHWLGNDKLHILTSNNGNCGRKLKIVLSDFNDELGNVVYTIFHVGDELSKYRLFVRGYYGNIGDSLYEENGEPFSTIDQDNDNYKYSCALHRQAGWWFDKCGIGCLNGPIQEGVESWQSMHWFIWRKMKCLKTSLMMLK